MATVEITLPRMGEGVIEATITRWLVKAGDKVNEDDPIAEVATDKVDSEIPSPVSGVVSELRFREGDTAQVGQVLAVVETEQEQEPSPPELVEKEVERIRATEPPPPVVSRETVMQEFAGDYPSKTPAGRFLSPLVRNIAKEENISPEEIDSITGQGKDGRLTKEDIMEYLARRKRGTAAEVTTEPETIPETTAPITETRKEPVAPVPEGTGDEIIEMDRVRRLIAEHMVNSVLTSPHVTSFIEADVTRLVVWRNKVKDTFFEREKQKFTFMPVFIEAAARALRDYPMVNVSLDGTRIIVKKRINIGMATALPGGNLIVPVVRDADEKSLVGLAKMVNDLASRARSNKLQPDEIQGGTFTITNFGTFDSITGTPIINQPQVAILGTGAIKKRPAVIETPEGEAIGIRHIIILSLAYDHRIIDGALGGLFLKRVADYLEGFDTKRSL